jgi:transposase InsO family protein
MSLLLRKLNNYRFTNEKIDEIINYLNTGNVPPNYNMRQENTFLEQFNINEWREEDGELHYNPNPNLDLIVVRPQNIQEKIQEIYDDFEKGLGTGQNQFHLVVASHYLNIPRKETTAFLRRQANYVLPRQYETKINKPILAKVANERWGIDICDLSNYRDLPEYNAGNQYILVVVDYFSRKVWARALRTQNGNSVVTALNNICNTSNTSPHIIQSDSGGAFISNPFRNFIQQRNIQLIKTTTYTPNSNGLVERMIQEIRKKIRFGFVRNNDLEWSNHLQDYCNNINSQKSRSTGFTPNQLWSEGYQPINNPIHHQINDLSTPEQIRETTQHRLLSTALRQIQRGRRNAEFFVGDRVRVRMNKLSSALRRLIKEGRQKQIVVKYTPEIYTVINVRNQVGGWDAHNTQYEVRGANGVVLQRNGNPVLFYGNEMILVPANSTEPSVPSNQRGNELNMV